MGRPKALLPLGTSHETFVRGLARALHDGGVDEVLIVGRSDDEALRDEVGAAGIPARYVENPAADGGQLTSVLAGLAVADRPGVRGILVTPVDAPRIAASTVAALLAAFRSTAAPVVRAVHNGRHGHPVIFARAVFQELRHADVSVGARAVVRAHAGRVVEVDVDDAGVLGDVDTPGDYQLQIGREL
jgi:molybdenum cofactor cytidylyltransferase